MSNIDRLITQLYRTINLISYKPKARATDYSQRKLEDDLEEFLTRLIEDVTGGGPSPGGDNIYNTNGVLTSDRVVALGAYSLSMGNLLLTNFGEAWYNGNFQTNGLRLPQVTEDNALVNILAIDGAGNTYTIDKATLGSGVTEWGTITGNIQTQTDLITLLDQYVTDLELASELANYIPLTEKGVANGVATLDVSGKLPANQLTISAMEYKGVWDADTNTPTLSDSAGNTGDVYIVSVPGTQDLDSGPITFAEGDWALYNGTTWEKSTNSNMVTSVFGRVGPIVAQLGDYDTALVPDTTDARYVTDAEKVVIGNTSGTNTGDETTSSIQTKRPLKTVNGETLDGVGDISIPLAEGNYYDMANAPYTLQVSDAGKSIFNSGTVVQVLSMPATLQKPCDLVFLQGRIQIDAQFSYLTYPDGTREAPASFTLDATKGYAMYREGANTSDYIIVELGGSASGSTDEAYNGYDTEANILASDPSTIQGELWRAIDTKRTFQATKDIAGNPTVWHQVDLIYNENTDTYRLPSTQDGQTQNLGQEVFLLAYNSNGTGATTLDPKVFMSVGSLVGKETFQETIKVVAGDIPNGRGFGLNTTSLQPTEYGKVSTYGQLNNVNTSAWNLNDVLYVDPTTPGEMTNVKPDINAYIVGKVLKVDATDGIIFVSTIGSTREDDAVIRLDRGNIFFTGDEDAVPTEGPFYLLKVEDEGSVTEVIETVVAPDNTAVAVAQDHWSGILPDGTSIDGGLREGLVEFEITGTGGNEKIYFELYVTDDQGLPIDSGRVDQVIGDLGVKPIFVMSTSLLDADPGDIFKEPLRGLNAETFAFATNQGLRVHVLCEKVGTAGPDKTFSIYYGSDHDTTLEILTGVTTDDVTNKSGVAGATATDALNNLNTSKLETVSTDSTLTGDGTPGDPLSVSPVPPLYPDGYYTWEPGDISSGTEYLVASGLTDGVTVNLTIYAFNVDTLNTTSINIDVHCALGGKGHHEIDDFQDWVDGFGIERMKVVDNGGKVDFYFLGGSTNDLVEVKCTMIVTGQNTADIITLPEPAIQQAVVGTVSRDINTTEQQLFDEGGMQTQGGDWYTVAKSQAYMSGQIDIIINGNSQSQRQCMTLGFASNNSTGEIIQIINASTTQYFTEARVGKVGSYAVVQLLANQTGSLDSYTARARGANGDVGSPSIWRPEVQTMDTVWDTITLVAGGTTALTASDVDTSTPKADGMVIKVAQGQGTNGEDSVVDFLNLGELGDVADGGNDGDVLTRFAGVWLPAPPSGGGGGGGAIYPLSYVAAGQTTNVKLLDTHSSFASGSGKFLSGGLSLVGMVVNCRSLSVSQAASFNAQVRYTDAGQGTPKFVGSGVLVKDQNVYTSTGAVSASYNFSRYFDYSLVPIPMADNKVYFVEINQAAFYNIYDIEIILLVAAS